MNVLRKHTSASPPVQVHVHSQHRGQHPYPNSGPSPHTYIELNHDWAQVAVPETVPEQVRQGYPVIQQITHGFPQGTAPHDMSKTPVPAHVPSAGQNHQPQPGMQQVMYATTPQQGQGPRPATPSFVQPRQTIPQNIRQPQQRQPTAMNMASSPGQPMYQTTMFVQGQPPPTVFPGQHMIIQQGHPPPMQVPYGAARMQGAQYTLTAQPSYSMTPSAPYYNPSPQQNTVYYTSPPTYPVQQQQPPPVRQPTPTQVYQKREKKIIKMTDPVTGRDLTEEIMHGSGGSKASTPPLSSGSSSRATPVVVSQETTPPSTNNDIAAQFAAQVAATLSQKNAQQKQDMSQDIPQELLSEEMNTLSYQAPEEEIMQEELVVQEKTQVIDPTIPEFVPSGVNGSKNIEEEFPSENMETQDEGLPEEPVQETLVVEEEAVNVNVSVPIVVEEPQDETEADQFDEVKREEETQEVEAEVTVNVSEPAEEEIKTTNEPETEVVEVVSEEHDEGKQANKKSRKQKLKELNQKGESKEGSDMDAFTSQEPVEEPAAPVLDATPSTSEVVPAPVVAAADLVNNVSDKQEEEENPVFSPAAPEPSQSAPEPEDSVVIAGKGQGEPEPPLVPDNKQVLVDNKMESEEQMEDKVAVENERNDDRTANSEDSTEQTTVIETETEPVIKKDKMELKYKYREDQWSPANPEGKRQYDRLFLLQFANEAQVKPEGLPKLPDVILDKQLPFPRNESRQFQSINALKPGVDFTPGFIRASPSGKGGPDLRRSRSQQKGGGSSSKEPRKVISIGITDIKLHHTENAWKPGMLQKDQDTTDGNKNEEIYGQVRSILNKLTPQKFEPLKNQILALPINTEERLVGAIDIVFMKAIDEPNFSVAYANLCKCMLQLKAPSDANPEEMVNFRNLLLNRCQKEFEKDRESEADQKKFQEEIDKATSEEEKKRLTEEKEFFQAKVKRQSLGNIRFIGELYKLKMLTEKIMHQCILKLIQAHDEESLECLCRLLTTIGKDIDHEKAKTRMDQIFTQIDKIIKQKRTSARVRFMLQDVVELRRNRWKPRREDNNPKTIDQIHKEVQKEDQERAIFLQTVVSTTQPPRRQKGAQGSGGTGGGRPGGMGSQSDDGWQSVGKPNRNTQTLDPTRMKLTKQNVDENIQLGPGGRFANWGRGSSSSTGGKATSSQETEKPGTPGNRFFALSAGRSGDFDRERDRGSASRGISSASRDSKGSRAAALGASRGRGAPGRSSQEHDREGALAAVRSLMGSRTPTGSRNQSRDSSRNRETPTEPEIKPSKELGQEEMEKKTKAIMDEYLHLQDLKEAITCVHELESPMTIYMFVYHALSHVLERSLQARQQTGALLHDLVKQNIVTVEAYTKGLKEILEFAEDMEIDIPKIWQYLGELVGPMVQDGSVPLSFVESAFQPLVRCGKAGILLAEVLNNAAHSLGHIKVGDLWKSSGLKWNDFIPQGVNVDDFVRGKKLEFTLEDVPVPRSPDAKTMSIESIQTQLDKLLVEQKVDNQDVFDWIEANVDEPRSRAPPFIRALMTSVCKSALEGTGPNMKVEAGSIQLRQILLQKFLDHQAELELQALYALQALVHSLDHPRGVLQMFFDTLYDEDIISEDAFYQWEGSTDPAEQLGKITARTAVTRFFTWLKEAVDEQES